MSFQKRWLIEGTLTVRTPLRIGDGNVAKRTQLVNDKTRQKIEVASVATSARHDAAGNIVLDANGDVPRDTEHKPSLRTHLPASTLKSQVRGWAVSHGIDQRAVEILFGSDDPEDKKLPDGTIVKAVAGKVEFDNAPAIAKPVFHQDYEEAKSRGVKLMPPYWCDERWTAIAAAVTLDRRTRTARDERLFHQEYVPPGVTYKVTLRVRDGDDDEGIAGDEGIIQLLALFDGFNITPHGIRLGSLSDDTHDEGWGRLDWKLTSIKHIDHAGIKKWLSGDASGMWFDALEEVKPDAFKRIEQAAQGKAKTLAQNIGGGRVPSLRLRLRCQDDFLVNDPSRTKKGRSRDDKLPNHAPLRDVDGNPILPQRSMRGAFRAQAEKILRTIGSNNAGNKNIACRVDDMQASCKAINSIGKVKDLCLACQVFGAPGWHAPFRITAFVAKNKAYKSERRDFIAVDRLTGGVAAMVEETLVGDEDTTEKSSGMKFDADVIQCPTLEGAIGIDLDALKRAEVGAWAIGLLALTLRDLCEGDIRVGFGKAKGFGEIVGEVAAIKPDPLTPCQIPEEFRFGLTDVELRTIKHNQMPEKNSKFGTVLIAAVNDLHRIVGERNISPVEEGAGQ